MSDQAYLRFATIVFLSTIVAAVIFRHPIAYFLVLPGFMLFAATLPKA